MKMKVSYGSENCSPESSMLYFSSARRLFHGVSVLSNRRFLKLKGPEAGKFLQGVTTNDINKLQAVGTGHYSALLNAQGRMMYDVFVYRMPEDSSFYIECDGQIQERVLLHLQTYNLRTKASIELVSDDSTVVFSSIQLEGSAAHLKDTRSDWNYCRYLFTRSSDAQASIKGLPSFSAGRYHRERILRGVPEGPFEIASRQAIPLEFNVDLMGGIDFAKGCYLGQELVARTLHRGVVRKRILPLRFFELDPKTLKPLRPAFEFDKHCELTKNLDKQSEFLPTEIDAETGKLRITSTKDSVGKLVMAEGNIGIGMMRLDALKSEDSRINLAVLDHVESKWILADAIIPKNWPSSVFDNL